MRKTETIYVCDICDRGIEFTARNKRLGLRIDDGGILIRESSTGDVCATCRPIIHDLLLEMIDKTRELSLQTEVEEIQEPGPEIQEPEEPIEEPDPVEGEEENPDDGEENGEEDEG